MSNTCALNVGRLLEIRAAAGYRDAADVDEQFDRIEIELARLPITQRAVVATDWRRCPLMSSDASDRMKLRIVRLNDRIERSAALSSGQPAVTMLQFLRLVRESEHPNRKLFEDAVTMTQWLAEVLTLPEVDRLRAFLAESPWVSGD